MSEPIQSISQGNYILQGTVATSAGIVGDGTTQNPLRADETVLWEGTAFNPAPDNNPMATSVSLNESINNFNQIRLDFSGGYIFSESVILTKPKIDADSWAWYSIKKEQNSNNVYIGTMYKFTDETTLSGKCSYGDSQVVQTMSGGYWGYGGVCKVVGINRIAGGN